MTWRGSRLAQLPRRLLPRELEAEHARVGVGVAALLGRVRVGARVRAKARARVKVRARARVRVRATVRVRARLELGLASSGWGVGR